MMGPVFAGSGGRSFIRKLASRLRVGAENRNPRASDARPRLES